MAEPDAWSVLFGDVPWHLVVGSSSAKPLHVDACPGPWCTLCNTSVVHCALAHDGVDHGTRIGCSTSAGSNYLPGSLQVPLPVPEARSPVPCLGARLGSPQPGVLPVVSCMPHGAPTTHTQRGTPSPYKSVMHQPARQRAASTTGCSRLRKPSKPGDCWQLTRSAWDDYAGDLVSLRECQSTLGPNALFRVEGNAADLKDLARRKKEAARVATARAEHLAKLKDECRARRRRACARDRRRVPSEQRVVEVTRVEVEQEASRESGEEREHVKSRFTRVARIARIALMAKMGSKRYSGLLELPESTQARRMTRSEKRLSRYASFRTTPDDAGPFWSRNPSTNEGQRSLQSEWQHDVEQALLAFSRYDTDGSGALELPEIRAVLEDLGLLPSTAQEKAGVRRTLVNLARGVEDGDTDLDSDSDSGPVTAGQLNLVAQSQERAAQQRLACTLVVSREQLPALITRIRARLRLCRSRAYFNQFHRFGVFESQQLELSTVLHVLEELHLAPRSEHDKARFGEWLAAFSGSKQGRGDAEEAEEDAVPGSRQSSKRSASPVARDLSGRSFCVAELEAIIEHLHEAKEQQASEEQRRLAHELGVREPRLFREFRRELSAMRELFQQYDEERVGFLQQSDAWGALHNLGLVPKHHADKLAIMRLIADSCEGCLAEERAPRKSIFAHWGEFSSPGSLSFQGFLSVVSKVRTSLQQSMQEELQPLFDRILRMRGAGDTALGMREVFRALEELGMAPTNSEEQLRISKFLEDANEWGFQPPSLDIMPFTYFIRRVREWKATMRHTEEREYASQELGFSERLVNEYRVAFCMADRQSTGELNIAGVREILALMGRDVSSDHLRALFTRADLESAGRITFTEFLYLVHVLEHSVQFQGL